MPRPIAFLRKTFIALLSALSAGCWSYSREYRVEQVARVGDTIKVVMGYGITKSSTWTSFRTFTRRRYSLLTFNLTDQTCPAISASEVLDASVGLPEVDLTDVPVSYTETPAETTGSRVDFLMGADPDRVTRVDSHILHRCLQQRVAVLGHDPKTGKWGILKSLVLKDQQEGGLYAASIDGHYVMFGSPAKVIDTRTLELIPPDGIAEMISAQHAEALAWKDWRARYYEAQNGSIAFSGPIGYGNNLDKFYAWDIESHASVVWLAGAPKCRGLFVLVRRGDRAEELRVLDVDTPMIGKGLVLTRDNIYVR